MSSKSKISIDIRKMTYLAILTALVVVLQAVIAPIIGSASGGVLTPALVLVPFVLGVAVCGVGAGVWLGAIFAVIVLVSDPSCAPFFAHNVFMTIVLVFLKGIGAGVVSGFIFKALSKKNKILAITLAAIAAPIVNTGIFVVGCWLFFIELTGIEIYTLFITANFALEMAVNLVFVPSVYKILQISRIA